MILQKIDLLIYNANKYEVFSFLFELKRKFKHSTNILNLLFKLFSTTDKVWTGIYVCKGDKHEDMFYCGAGRWILDKNKKIKVWDDSTWSGFGQEFTLGIQIKQFASLLILKSIFR